jgi:two-component system chemotaxis response regulator CheY
MSEKYQVMAVDDSAFTLTIISTYLENSEFEVVEAARNGSDAIERFREVEPDLVLLDIVMPGLSGQETLRQILEIRPDAKVVMVSSLGTEEDVRECLEIGARSFLKKPFAKEDLIEFLRELVATAPGGGTS